MTGNSENAAADKVFLQQLISSNAPAAMLAFYGASIPSDHFEYFPAAYDALSLFLDCRADYETISSMAGVQRLYRGVNRCELEAVINLNGIARKRRPALFSQIKMIERGALQGFREQQESAV
jgi:hypothetical protein